jgi:gluconate 2-dehydrogenase alpha chain
MRTLPSADILIIGGGWTGMLMAKELGARTSQSVVVLERGGPRKTQDYAADMDELDYMFRMHMMQDRSEDTVTIRRNSNERALPVRDSASFISGTGTGGSGEHWGAQCTRFMPGVFDLYSKTVARYGAKKLPEDSTIQDWGMTYDELEPHYMRVEQLLGTSGKAGNVKGKKIEGGNVFEGWRSAGYPNPPIKLPYFGSLFGEASKSLGYHPFPIPAAVNSEPYTNPDGVTRAACAFCGFCEHTGCMISAKAQPTNTLMPVIRKHTNVSIRTGTLVRRIVRDTTQGSGRARGVTYVDASGEEIFQPADLIVLSTFTANNNRILFLSGVGTPYDPMTGKGTLGKNLTHHMSVPAAQGIFEKPFNRFMGAGGAGMRFADFEEDEFDHSNLPFIRGGNFGAIITGIGPISAFGAVPRSVKARWGSEWKKAAIEHYDRIDTVAFAGGHIPYKGNFLDLDPTYKDPLGDSLLRVTINWHDNERNMMQDMTAKAVEIARTMGAKEIHPFAGYGDYDPSSHQNTMLHGGTMMSTSPELGVVNPHLQHWEFPNLFILGASTFPNPGTVAATPTVLALTLRAADAIVDRYLKKPGPLA